MRLAYSRSRLGKVSAGTNQYGKRIQRGTESAATMLQDSRTLEDRSGMLSRRGSSGLLCTCRTESCHHPRPMSPADTGEVSTSPCKDSSCPQGRESGLLHLDSGNSTGQHMPGAQ